NDCATSIPGGPPAFTLVFARAVFSMTRHIDTRLLHTGTPVFDADTGVAPVNVPTVRTSTVRFADMSAYRDVFRRKAGGERIPSYGRQGMDTHHALEDAINL